MSGSQTKQVHFSGSRNSLLYGLEAHRITRHHQSYASLCDCTHSDHLEEEEERKKANVFLFHTSCFFIYEQNFLLILVGVGGAHADGRSSILPSRFSTPRSLGSKQERSRARVLVRADEPGLRGGALEVVEAPAVLLADLFLVLGREVVLDAKRGAYLVGRLAVDHVGHRLAREVEQGLDVKVVGGEDEVEQRRLLHVAERLVPRADLVLLLLVLLFLLLLVLLLDLLGRSLRVFVVVLGPLNHLPSKRGGFTGQL